MFSLLIQRARLIDGTGAPERLCDIAIEDERIAAVDDVIDAGAGQIIDAGGMVVSPGFIDVQNHSDSYWQLFDNPGLESMLQQGYTTLLVGHCGASLAPLLSPDGLLPLQKWHSLSGINSNWQSFSEFAALMKSQRLGCNVASLVGYSTLRRGLMKEDVGPLDAEQQSVIASSIKQALHEGAFGLSSGLSYSHEVGVSQLELFDAVKIVTEAEGLFSVHLRNEGNDILSSLEEICDVALHSGGRVKISHFKIRGGSKDILFNDALMLIDTAKHRGAKLWFDLYPYETLWQPVHSYLPKWAIMGGRAHLLEAIHDPVRRNQLLQYLNSHESDIKNFVVASTANRLNVVGKPLAQIAQTQEVSSEQALLNIIENGGSEVMVFDKDLRTEHVQMLMKHPLSLIGTDGGGFAKEGSDMIAHQNRDMLVHPRCFGTAPQFIRSILDSKVLNLPDAVRKLTGAAAEVVGLKNHGVVAPGKAADLVIFDDTAIRDRATLENPYQYPEGIGAVIVNGKVAIDHGKNTDVRAGRFLKKH